VELQPLDLDLTQDQAASQRQPDTVGAQQGAPVLVVQRGEGDVAKLGGRTGQTEKVVVQALRVDGHAELACRVRARLVQHAAPHGRQMRDDEREHQHGGETRGDEADAPEELLKRHAQAVYQGLPVRTACRLRRWSY
jgi:hypothetical protein